MPNHCFVSHLCQIPQQVMMDEIGIDTHKTFQKFQNRQVVLQTFINYTFLAFFYKKLRRFVNFSCMDLNRCANESRDPGASFELSSVF